jgi:hypothetical protein
MSQSIWLALMFMPPGSAQTEGIQRPELAAVAWTAEELTRETAGVILRVKNPSRWQPAADVPALALWYHAVEVSAQLPRAEQVRLRKRLDYWLNQAHDRLLRRLAVLNQEARSRPVTATAATDRTLNAKAAAIELDGGAAEVQQVRQLIDLIEMTIQPDTWANNGGLGTIGYYSPLHLLVIRNNQQVHREVGGLIGILGAQQ